MSVVGARPNLMKIAPFIHAIERFEESAGSHVKIINQLVHTGQHYDQNMSDSFFEDLNIPRPDYHLGVGSGSHAYQMGQTMIEFEKVLLASKPDWVVVVGDVNATGSCSITAKKHQFRVAHIEAGLRSNDWTMPEEINRIITDRVSDLLLTPCRFADENLKREGASAQRIERVGNIMIDTLEANREKAASMDINAVVSRNIAQTPEENKTEKARSSKARKLTGEDFVLLTMHRPSNVDEPQTLKALMDALQEIAEKYPIVFPIHPRTRERLKEFALWDVIAENKNIIATQPIGYLDFLCLNMRARVLLTDSGGLQEEACVLGTPCLTLRWNTERPVVLVENGGTNILVGNDPEKIRNGFKQMADFPRKEHRPELWDGHTAERVVSAIVNRTK